MIIKLSGSFFYIFLDLYFSFVSAPSLIKSLSSLHARCKDNIRKKGAGWKSRIIED